MTVKIKCLCGDSRVLASGHNAHAFTAEMTKAAAERIGWSVLVVDGQVVAAECPECAAAEPPPQKTAWSSRTTES